MRRNLFEQALDRIKQRVSKLGLKVLIVSLGDNNPHIPMPSLPPGYTAEKLEPKDLLPWAADDIDLPATFLHTAQARGDRCVANFYTDEHGTKSLVGYGFVTRSYAPVTDQTAIRIAPHLRYRYKGWTSKAHRRKHLSHARGRLNSTLFPMLAGNRMISYVEWHNFASRLTNASVRPVKLGYCVILKVLGREFVFNSPIVKRYGFELVPHKEAGK